MTDHWRDGPTRPEVVLCSPAQRARETAEIVARAWTPSPERRLDESLYLAAPGTILRAVAAVEPERQGVLVVGHNPGLGDLAGQLADGRGSAAQKLRAAGFPPAALAGFELDVEDWREIDAPWARLVEFRTP